MINEGLKLRGDVALVLRDKDGNVKDERHIENLIVDTGLNFICDRMKDDETAMTHMALGSGTTAAAAGDTSLEHTAWLTRNTRLVNSHRTIPDYLYRFIRGG